MNEILAKKPTGAGLDAMMSMLPHLSEIAHDEELNKARARIRENKEMDTMEIISAFFPLLACKHRTAVYGIVSAVTGKTDEEIDAQSLEETMNVFFGATGDEIMSFFTLFVRMGVRM